MARQPSQARSRHPLYPFERGTDVAGDGGEDRTRDRSPPDPRRQRGTICDHRKVRRYEEQRNPKHCRCAGQRQRHRLRQGKKQDRQAVDSRPGLGNDLADGHLSLGARRQQTQNFRGWRLVRQCHSPIPRDGCLRWPGCRAGVDRHRRESLDRHQMQAVLRRGCDRRRSRGGGKTGADVGKPHLIRVNTRLHAR